MEPKYVNQRIECIALSEINAGKYQRGTNNQRVARIAGNFNVAKLGMPVVSKRGNQCFLLDGAHRIAALRILEYSHAMCIVMEGLTYEEEAKYFMNQNQDSRPLSRFNLFRAGVEAQDELCVNINRIVSKNGFRITGSSHTPGSISSIKALEIVAVVYGYPVLDSTLSLIQQTWGGTKNAARREFIVGVAEFVSRFGTCDFAERMRGINTYVILNDYEQAAFSLSRKSADGDMRKSFCRVLVRHYNKGLPPRSPQRLVMEGEDEY